MLAMKGGLLQELRYLSNTEAYEQILEGWYIPPEETDSYAKEFLTTLACSSTLVQNPKVIITTAKFQID